MSRIGNEAKLIIKLVNERADRKLADHKSQNEGSEKFQQRTSYRNGAQMVLDLLNSVPKELDQERK